VLNISWLTIAGKKALCKGKIDIIRMSARAAPLNQLVNLKNKPYNQQITGGI
jgi:hypothetical protein